MHEQTSVPLSELTTIHLGGDAARVVVAESTEEIVQAVLDAQAAGDRVLLLAGGSNLVIADEGFDGTVVRIASRGISFEPAPDGHVDVTVAAGENWDAFVGECVSRGWAGVECLAGIPGAVGSTPIQNVGAYGQDVSSTITAVAVLDRATHEVRSLPAVECAFGYRTSRFKRRDDFVVLGVTFRLRQQPMSAPIAYAELARSLDVPVGGTAPLAEVAGAVVMLRRGKGMVLDPQDHDTWSCGSFFTNPMLDGSALQALTHRAARRLGPDVRVPHWSDSSGGAKISAAWLIQHSGFDRGYSTGPVGISSKHTLALTNRGGARAEDLIALARQVRGGVREQWGVTLHPEPVLVGVSLD